MSEQAQTINEFWKSLGILTATLRTAREVIELCFKSGHVPCLIGEAGIGKTAIYKQIADDLGWDILYYYLAHQEPEDIIGLPVPGKDGSYQFYVEKSIRNVISSDKPTVIVFDEWNRGDKAVSNAAFTVMEQRRFGSIVLPPHVHIAAAMNPSESTYLVNEAEKDPAFRRRLCFIGVRVDQNVFLEYARGRGNFHPTVIDFIERQGEQALLDVPSRDAGKVYACPASYEKASDTFFAADKMLEEEKTTWDDLRSVLRVKLAGHLGTGTAEELLAFHQDNLTLVNPQHVIEMYHKRARPQILRLVEGHKHGILGRAVESVAAALASGRYDTPEDYADNISDFANDIPQDISGRFFSSLSHRLAELADQDPKGKELRARMTRALGKCPSFKASFNAIVTSLETAEGDREKSGRK